MSRNTYTRGCNHSQGWRNYLNHTRRTFFDRAKTPLIPEAHSYYFDTGIGANLCNNSHHGCSLWTGLDGKPQRRVFIDEERELRLNAYRMIRRTGPDAHIYVHFGWRRAMALQTFADIILSGEGPEGDVVADGGYYQLFTPEFFRATFSPYIWGIKMVLEEQSLRSLQLASPDAYLAFSLDNPANRRQIVHTFGYCVVHDVDTLCTGTKTLPLRQALWAAQDALGWDENVRLHSYWENNTVRRLGDDIGRIMASAYTKNGKMLLAVMNDTDEERTVELELDLKTLGMKAGGEGIDVWDPERHYTLDARWSGTVPPRSCRLILWP